MTYKKLLTIPALIWAQGVLADNGVVLPVSNAVPVGFEDIAVDDRFYDVVLNGRYYKTFDLSKKNRFFDEKITSTPGLVSIDFKAQPDGMIYEDEDKSVFIYKKQRRIDVFDKKAKDEHFEKVGFSFGSSFSGATSSDFGSGVNRESFHLSNKLTYNEHAVKFDGSWIDEDFSLGDVFYSTEHGENRVDIGSFRPTNQSVNSSFYQVYGLNYSFGAKDDERGGARENIELLLRSPANVVVRRGEELVETKSLEQGMQVLDTTRYPAGIYYVDIDIYYLNGESETRKERLSLKSKSGVDNWSFDNVIVGAKEKNLRGETAPYLSTLFNAHSYSKGNTQLGFSYFDDSFYFTPEIHLNDEYVRFDSRLNLSSKSTWDIDARLSVDVDRHRVSMSYSRDKFSENQAIRGYFSANYSYSSKDYGYFYSTINKSTNRTTSYQLFHSYNWFIDRKYKLGLVTSLVYANEATFGLEISFGAQKGNTRYRGSAEYYDQETSYRHSLNYRDSYEGGNYSGQVSDIRRNGYESQFAQLAINDGRYGSGSVQLGSNNGSSYLNTSFYSSVSGDLNTLASMGVNNYNQGVLIDLSDAPSGDYLVDVNGSMQKVSSGENYFKSLSPHSKYSVKLINETNPQATVEASDKNFYLHKDNLFIPKWNIYKTKLFFGRLLKGDEPIKNKLVKTEVSEAFTDDNGYLAVQMKKNEKVLHVNGMICDLVIPKNSINSGDVKCTN